MLKWISLLLISLTCSAQSEIDLLIDQWYQPDWDENQLQNIREELEQLYIHPMSIQQYDPMTLAEHPLITEMEAINICYHIKKTGAILDWHELNDVPGITEDWIALRKPFLTLNWAPREPDYSLHNLEAALKVGLSTSLPSSAGFRERKFAGPNFQDQGSLQMSWEEFSGALRWQRDAGEALFKHGYDHLSGFVQFSPRSGTYSISLGSFRSGFGSGLLSGSSFGRGIPSSISQIHRKASRTRASAPGGELQDWKGATVQFMVKRWSFHLASGLAHRDARIDDSSILSFPNSGLHRTDLELERRMNTLLHHHEVKVQYSGNTFTSSVFAGSDVLPLPFNNRKFLGGLSWHFQWMKGPTHFQSEMAIDHLGKPAGIFSISHTAGDYQLGARVLRISRDFEPLINASSGIYFTGSNQQSAEIILSSAYQKLSYSLSAFTSRQELEWLQSESKRGVQIQLQHRNWNKVFTLRWRLQQTEGAPFSLYTTHRWERPFNGLFANARLDVHIYQGGDYAYLIQAGAKKSWNNIEVRGNARLYSDNSTGIPTYAMSQSTSMLLRIQRLSGTGSQLDLLINYTPTNRIKLQATALIDVRLNEPFRGSGDSETKGKTKWILCFEAHFKLGKL